MPRLLPVAAIGLVALLATAAPISQSAVAAEAKDATATAIEDLVYANRILAFEGILDAFGHVSVRSPTNPEHFFLSRSLAPALISTGDMIEFDLSGEPVKPTKDRLYSERYIHAAAYRARPDVKSVLHSHSPEVLPFTISKTPLRAVIHDAAFIGLAAPVYESDHDGANGTLLITDMKHGAELAAKLGKAEVALIRGHGQIIVGGSAAEVTTRAVFVDKNARAQKEAAMLGGQITYLTPKEIAERAKLLASYTEGRDWTLLKSKVDELYVSLKSAERKGN